MLALVGLLTLACLPPLATDEGSLVGTPAPDFNLQGLDGKQLSPKALRGHIVVLHFWATYWQSCYADMGYLEKLHREFKDQGVVVVGINVGQLERVVREFVSKRGYTYPQLINARGELILRYQATEAPTIVIIGKDGTIVDHLSEQQGEEALRSALKKAMQ